MQRILTIPFACLLGRCATNLLPNFNISILFRIFVKGIVSEKLKAGSFKRISLFIWPNNSRQLPALAASEIVTPLGLRVRIHPKQLSIPFKSPCGNVDCNLHPQCGCDHDLKMGVTTTPHTFSVQCAKKSAL